MSIQNKRARSSAEESELVPSAITCYHILLFVHSFSSNVVLACFGRILYITFSGSYLGNNFEGGDGNDLSCMMTYVQMHSLKPYDSL